MNNLGSGPGRSRPIAFVGEAVPLHEPEDGHASWHKMPGTVCHFPSSKSTLRWEPIKLAILAESKFESSRYKLTIRLKNSDLLIIFLISNSAP